MKKIIALILVAIVVASMFSFSASAQTGFWLGGNSYTYNRNTYATCQLSNVKKDAKVKVTLTNTGGLTVKMTDSKGRHLWSESNSIKPNFMGSGSRTYKLGKGRSVYRMYFKSSKPGFCSIKAVKNCSVW